MPIQLPAAPANFYAPSLQGLKTALETVNGSSVGRVALLTAPPGDIDNAWLEVGATYNTDKANNRGTLVIGHASLGVIKGPMQAGIESGGEAGYKLQIEGIKDIPIYIDGSGTSTRTIVGIALLEGKDSMSLGNNDNVRYIIKVEDIIVTDGKKIALPQFEIIINYSEVDTGIN